ncbi:hypothetical protein FA95DRAFT_1606053 [Auriscalpium vulgare]|uniref:Uncharacterized protein n=1 Tax=Auriscalpium vulgare TaxID=40419 RepID=A0ACB8RTK6_9AGAM|nr:hypothetical protein FA95DRAFT_1606053 [Auriscalpium vulgare]
MDMKQMIRELNENLRVAHGDLEHKGDAGTGEVPLRSPARHTVLLTSTLPYRRTHAALPFQNMPAHPPTLFNTTSSLARVTHTAPFPQLFTPCTSFSQHTHFTPPLPNTVTPVPAFSPVCALP